MFEGYTRQRRPDRRRLRFGTVSALLHGLALLILVTTPLWTIRAVPAPPLAVTLFDAPPPPPPPPPPPGGAGLEKPQRPKEPEQPKKPEPLEEPQPDAEIEPQPEPEPVDEAPPSPGGQEGGTLGGREGGEVGGQQGGVVGGTLGGQVGAPLLQKAQRRISGDEPRYPPQARGQRGIVVARVCIDAHGKVSSVTIIKSAALFDAAVKDAVRSWRYDPYLVGGQPIPACFPAYFQFTQPKE